MSRREVFGIEWKPENKLISLKVMGLHFSIITFRDTMKGLID